MSWDKLPGEMKELILKQTTNNARLALSACSSNDKEFVSSVNFKQLSYHRIGRSDDGKLMIKYQFDDKPELFETFEAFQSEIQKTLSRCDFLERLEVYGMDLKVQLQKQKPLSGNQQQLKVAELDVKNASAGVVLHIMNQVDPMFLRRIDIRGPEKDGALFDTPQVIHTEVLCLEKSVKAKIRENQLLKLQTRKFEMRNGITFSVKQFIKKCLIEANSRLIDFLFYFNSMVLIKKSLQGLRYVTKKDDEGKYLITMDTPYRHLKLKMIVTKQFPSVSMKGWIDFDSEKSASLHSIRDNSVFRIVKELCVYCNGESLTFEITIIRADQPTRVFNYKSSEQVKKKLDEVLENADYVKFFEIKLMGGLYPWVFKPREKLLTVGELKLYGTIEITQTFKNLISQFEVSLKKLDISCKLSTDFYDMPQVTHAEYVTLIGFFLDDITLLKMNAPTLRMFALKSYHYFEENDFLNNFPFNYNLTETGMNEYFKKCIRNLEQEDFMFSVELLEGKFNEKKLLEGLDVISIEKQLGFTNSTRLRNGVFATVCNTTVLVNSASEEYVYQILFNDDVLRAKRELRKKALAKPKQQMNSPNI